jgi:hypothetical protein
VCDTPQATCHAIGWTCRYNAEKTNKKKKEEGLTGGQTDLLDWNGDHPHTNFRSLLLRLRADGYMVDVTTQPLTCLPLAEYGVLLLPDSEAALSAAEMAAVQTVRALSGNMYRGGC